MLLLPCGHAKASVRDPPSAVALSLPAGQFTIPRASWLHQGQNGRWGIALQTVVDEQEQELLVLAGAANQHAHGIAGLRVGVLHFAIRREGGHGVLIDAAVAKQGAAHQESGGGGIRNRNLVAQFGHLRPGVVDVGHSVAAQAGEVILFEKSGIADLHGVAELRRQAGEERVEAIQKLRQAGETAASESAEFEDHQRGLLPVGKQRADEHVLEHPAIQEGFVVAAAGGAVSRVDREYLARDLLGHLEGEAEMLGRQLEQAAPELLGGKLVEGEIAAHRGKSLRVFAEALGLEKLLREFAAGEVAFPAIDLAEPSFVFPGTAADEDVVRREPAQFGGEALGIEGAWVVYGAVEEPAEVSAYHACAARK